MICSQAHNFHPPSQPYELYLLHLGSVLVFHNLARNSGWVVYKIFFCILSFTNSQVEERMVGGLFFFFKWGPIEDWIFHDRNKLVFSDGRKFRVNVRLCNDVINCNRGKGVEPAAEKNRPFMICIYLTHHPSVIPYQFIPFFTCHLHCYRLWERNTEKEERTCLHYG